MAGWACSSRVIFCLLLVGLLVTVSEGFLSRRSSRKRHRPRLPDLPSVVLCPVVEEVGGILTRIISCRDNYNSDGNSNDRQTPPVSAHPKNGAVTVSISALTIGILALATYIISSLH